MIKITSLEARKRIMNLPKDPVILVSFINTQLRDFYPSLDELCKANNFSKEEIIDILSSVDYEYDAKSNRFF